MNNSIKINAIKIYVGICIFTWPSGQFYTFSVCKIIF